MNMHLALSCGILLSRDDDGTPVTARRFLAIAQPGGDDDYFSFGFSHEERQVACLWVAVIAPVICCGSPRMLLCLADQQAQMVSKASPWTLCRPSLAGWLIFRL